MLPIPVAHPAPPSPRRRPCGTFLLCLYPAVPSPLRVFARLGLIPSVLEKRAPSLPSPRTPRVPDFFSGSLVSRLLLATLRVLHRSPAPCHLLSPRDRYWPSHEFHQACDSLFPPRRARSPMRGQPHPCNARLPSPMREIPRMLPFSVRRALPRTHRFECCLSLPSCRGSLARLICSRVALPFTQYPKSSHAAWDRDRALPFSSLCSRMTHTTCVAAPSLLTPNPALTSTPLQHPHSHSLSSLANGPGN